MKLSPFAVSVTINVLLLYGVGYLSSREPETKVETKVVEVEKVVVKEVVKVEYRDRVQYKDRIVVEKVTTPDGTVSEKTTTETEGSRDTSIATVTDKVIDSTVSKVTETVTVANPTKMTRYSLGVDYSLKNTIEKKSLTPDWKSVTIGISARIGDLPVFVGVSSRLDGSEFGLGIRVEW